MLCYKDMTFCTSYEDCDYQDECHRPLTPQVLIAAENFGLPICRFSDKPSCHSDFKDTNPKETN